MGRIGKDMTKHLEVWDAHQPQEPIMRVSSQDQLLMALWDMHQKRQSFYDYQIIYIDSFEQREYVAEVRDEDILAWFMRMDELHMRLLVEFGTSTLGFLEFLAMNNYHVEFTESNYSPAELDFGRYYAQVKNAQGFTSFHDGATKLEAAAYAYMDVKGRE